MCVVVVWGEVNARACSVGTHVWLCLGGGCMGGRGPTGQFLRHSAPCMLWQSHPVRDPLAPGGFSLGGGGAGSSKVPPSTATVLPLSSLVHTATRRAILLCVCACVCVHSALRDRACVSAWTVGGGSRGVCNSASALACRQGPPGQHTCWHQKVLLQGAQCCRAVNSFSCFVNT